ncbi:hypothetical protein GCM10007908_24340 [Rhizobium albus]|nr:hypothetical protein GCM10007908_24340 [Rhizobium albus]
MADQGSVNLAIAEIALRSFCGLQDETDPAMVCGLRGDPEPTAASDGATNTAEGLTRNLLTKGHRL